MAEFSLAKRLREEADLISEDSVGEWKETCNLLEEAADEIERLEDKLSRVRVWLEKSESEVLRLRDKLADYHKEALEWEAKARDLEEKYEP